MRNSVLWSKSVLLALQIFSTLQTLPISKRDVRPLLASKRRSRAFQPRLAPMHQNEDGFYSSLMVYCLYITNINFAPWPRLLQMGLLWGNLIGRHDDGPLTLKSVTVGLFTMLKILVNALNGTASSAARQLLGDSREREWLPGLAAVCLCLSRFELAEWWLKRNTIGPRVQLCALHPSITSRAFSERSAPSSNESYGAAVQGAVQCKGCLEARTTEVTRHFLYLTHVMETTVRDQSRVKSRWNFVIKLISPTPSPPNPKGIA